MFLFSSISLELGLIFVVAVLHKIQEQDERFPSTVLKILIPKHKKKKIKVHYGSY